LEDNIESCNNIIKLHKKADNFNPKEENMKDEYKFFTKYIDEDEEHEKNLNPGKSKLDRYGDIKPNKNNTIEINKNKEKKNHYINASGINHKYFIAAQGPKNQITVEDFWTMIDEQNSKVIVMLCKEVEGGKKKCANYWNDKEEIGKFENYEITVTKEEEKQEQEYIIREINLGYKSEEKKSANKDKKITQIHFIGWPDKGVPDIKNGNVFDHFIEIIEKVDEKRGDSPVIVHCSAGVGRTGTFITMYFLYKEIMGQIKENKNEIIFNIVNLVRKMKEMRLHMVQVFAQYKFIYDFVVHVLKKYNQ
jgi:protein tyrosine phosphatase